MVIVCSVGTELIIDDKLVWNIIFYLALVLTTATELFFRVSISYDKMTAGVQDSTACDIEIARRKLRLKIRGMEFRRLGRKRIIKIMNRRQTRFKRKIPRNFFGKNR